MAKSTPILRTLVPWFLPLSLHAQLINPGFETTPYTTGWTANATTRQTPGLNGSASAARLPYNTPATLSQSFAPLADFTLDVDLAVAGNTTNESFRILIDSPAGNLIELRGGLGNILQLVRNGTPHPLTSISGNTPFPFPGNQPIRCRIVARHLGTAAATFDLAWSNPNSTALTHAATDLTAFSSKALATTGPANRIRFDRINNAAHSYWIDDVILIPSTSSVPAADHQVTDAEPPAAPQIVNISGVYPHLAVTNSKNECGIGAVVPWQGDLWAITYAPHEPGGSDDKLYQILPGLTRIIRPESIGGTPANRFIHTASNQLIIGPHFIDSSKNVRTLPYSAARGRHTANAAHLTDPENRVYFFTMEDGLYDVNVHDLSVITRYPDVQGTGDDFLFGYHGKGAYTGGGRLIVANNGRSGNQDDPTGDAGVLASWDGSVRGSGDPNPGRMTAWTEHFRVQHCEVTGPGGIYGNPGSADPVWATGFDWKSVVLRTWENGAWTTWRLPKSSYTHDGSHGWHTEWPRIREISPGRFLMHMHGMFYDFPGGFSTADFSGLSPICSYYKMPVDYCTWENQLVIAKNDTSKFSNSLVPQAQSNFWFGQLSDLGKWGSPQGHGSVWRGEPVSAGQSSEPFLLNGFANGTLHLRNGGPSVLPIDLMTSDGSGTWTPFKTLAIPANGYLAERFATLPAAWMKLTAQVASANVTATFLLSNPYPHPTPASIATDRFAAIADIRDERSLSDGLIRVMNGADLKMEMASKHIGPTGPATTSYQQIGAPMELETIANAALENAVRTAAATSNDIGSDAASAWITLGGAKLRLPKLDPLYDSPFLSGWGRSFREAVTERVLLNCHGTFYEVPRDNSGGRRKIQPIATHGKRITDFTSWRGLLAITGVLDSAPASDSLVKSADARAAVWLGEIDDIWRMGEPRGTGGPWLDTAVTANTVSDPYLMYGYRSKSLRLSHASPSPVTFTVEVDFLADNTWSTYATFTVQPGETFTHDFPAGYTAHWVRLKSGASTTATAQFTYGPATVRDRFLDWARTSGLPTGSGRNATAANDDDLDDHPALLEYALDTDPGTSAPLPLATAPGTFETLLRDDLAADQIPTHLEISPDLTQWQTADDLLLPSPDQSTVPAGFTRMRALVTDETLNTRFPGSQSGRCFFRIRATLPAPQ